MLPPLLAARLWRFRVAIGLVAFLALFHVGGALLFEPTARRYERAVRNLGSLAGNVGSAATLPPRVYRLMAENSRPASEVEALAASGGLASSLLGTVTDAMARAGVRLVATDPGTVAPAEDEVQVKLEVRARARYAQVVNLLDRLARTGKLIQIERMSLLSESGSELELQLVVSQHVFKSGGTGP